MRLLNDYFYSMFNKARLPNISIQPPTQQKFVSCAMSHLTGFNNLFDRFLGKLVEWNPELTDINTLKTTAELLRKVNPRAVLTQFMDLIRPFYIHVLQENEAFLTDLNNLQKHSTFKEYDDKSFAIDKMIVFTSKWGTYTDSRKARFWKLIKALVKIGALASHNPEDKKILEYISANPHVF